MNTTAQTKKGARAQHPGPPLAVPAIGFAALFVASLITGPTLGSGNMPSPFSSPDVIQHYFSTSEPASQTGGFLLFFSAIMLALFSAIALSRLDFLAPNAPGPAIGAVGGILASVFLAISALIQWALSRPSINDQPVLVHALQYLMFLCGGPAHTVALGILVFGIAITSWFLRRLPWWLPVTGMVIAAIAVLSSITLLVPAMAPLLPIGRFTAMVWIIAMSVLLPRTRAARRPATNPDNRTSGQVSTIS